MTKGKGNTKGRGKKRKQKREEKNEKMKGENIINKRKLVEKCWEFVHVSVLAPFCKIHRDWEITVE